VLWDSLRRPDGGWTVTALFTARTADVPDTELIARFSVSLVHRTVSALNEVGADMLSGDLPSALRPHPAPPPLSPVVALRPAADDERDDQPPSDGEARSILPADDATAFDRADEPPPAAAGRAQRHETRSPLRLPSRRQKARTHPIPVALDDELLGEYFENPDTDLVADVDGVDSVDGAGGLDWDAPALPLEFQQTGVLPPMVGSPDSASASEDSEPDAGKSGSRRGRSNDKPRMPSWDDILLGVRRRSD
jgi:hypothetical protein